MLKDIALVALGQCFSIPSPRTQMSPWKGVDESAKRTRTVRVKREIYDHVANHSV